MPRKPRTLSGAEGSPPRPSVGVPYGEGERRLESQRRTPVPAGPPSAPGAQTSGGGVSSPPPSEDPRQRMAAAVAAAAQMRPPQGLFAPTDRPDEPIQAGMSMGPGGGPELLRTGDRVSRTLRLLAEVSDDPRWAQLAELAAARSR